MDWKKNFGPENRTQKNIDRQATTHKWWTEGKNLGSENRTQKKKSIVRPQHINGGLKQ